jgi:hypothetical protein
MRPPNAGAPLLVSDGPIGCCAGSDGVPNGHRGGSDSILRKAINDVNGE